MRILDTILVEAGLIMALAFMPCAKAQRMATVRLPLPTGTSSSRVHGHRITVATCPSPICTPGSC